MISVVVPAWRFVHGKVCAEPGGPVTPGFEHRPTSISAGLPAQLLPLCRPGDLLDNQSVQALVHAGREREGALWFWPAGAEGQRYMLASCVRARPESGEGGLSRTHTQLVTYVFKEADWNADAPRLIANAAHWLRAEPDTEADYERYRNLGVAPRIELGPRQLPEAPRCASGPLPQPGSLIWRLTTALEVAGHNLGVGPADGIRSVEHFLKALACVAALLPEPLRIYLSAAAGFAAPLRGRARPFALQFRPEAPALGRGEPGLLEQIARGWLQLDPSLELAGWQACWAERRGPARTGDTETSSALLDDTRDADVTKLLSALTQPRWHKGAPLQTADLARARYAEVCDSANARRSVTDLVAWLMGRQPDPPPRPALHHDNTAAKWVLSLTRHLNDGLARPAADARGLARALARLATLVDTDGPPDSTRVRTQAAFWAIAWRRAAAGRGRAVLRWAALLATPLIDDLPVDLPRLPELAPEAALARRSRARPAPNAPLRRLTDPNPLGWIADCEELRVLFDAIARAQAEGPQEAALVEPLLKANAVKRRIRALRERVPRLLARRPAGAIALAAAWPALLATRPDDDPAWVAGMTATVRALLIGTRLRAWHRDPTKARRPRDDAPRQRELLAAVARIAERSCGLDTTDATLQADLIRNRDQDLSNLLWHYWHWAMAPNDARDLDCTLWREAVVGLLRAVAPRDDPAVALRLLLSRVQRSFSDAVGANPDLTKAGPATEQLFTACLDALAPVNEDPRAPNPALVAAGLLRALPDPRLLAPAVGGGLAADALGNALGLRLRDAIAHPKADPALLAGRVLPLFTEPCARLATTPGGALTASAIGATLELAHTLIQRLLAAGGPLPRAPLTRLFEALEQLCGRDNGGAALVQDAAERLGLSLAGCLVAWAAGEPPVPRVQFTVPLARAPIRRLLARRLGYPRCAYFGGLTDCDDKELVVRGIQTYHIRRVDQPTHQALGWPLTAELAGALQRLLGYGAAHCWSALFADPDLKARNLLARLLREQSNQGAGNEALAALADLLLDAPPGLQRMIDPDVWFTVDFFAGLDPQRRAAPLLLPPPALTRALISDGALHHDAFAIQLGRLLLTGNAVLTQPLLSLFAHPEANAHLGRRVLLLAGDWDDFAAVDDGARALALQRLLYLLALLRCESRVGAERRFIPEQELARALHFAPGHDAGRAAMADYLGRQPLLRGALADGARLVGLAELPGWPLG